MGDVDKDTAIASMMSVTGSEDFDLLTKLLEDNAWCVELAVESFNAIQSAGGGAGGGTRTAGGGGNNDSGRGAGHDYGGDEHIPLGEDGAPLQPGGGGGGGGGDDVRVVGDFRQRMGAERNPTNQTFESRQLQQLFKSPEYAEKLGTNGWRGAGEKAARESKYIILNIQEGSNFWSHRIDRDVWSNDSVRNVVMCDFLLVQVWKDGDNYRDIVNAYPDVDKLEFPLVLILDFASRMELKRITYKQLLTHAGISLGGGTQQSQKNDALQLAMSMAEILTTFIERQQTMNNREPSMEQRDSSMIAVANNNNGGTTNTTTTSNNNNNNDNTDAAQNNNNTTGTTSHEDDIATALRLSQEMANNNNSTKTDDAAATSSSISSQQQQQQQNLPEPDDSVDTLEHYRASGSGEGIMKLRVKLPISGGDIVDWDIFLPKSTPQRAFTRGVRYEMKSNRGSAVPARTVIKISRMDRSRKQVEIFREDVSEADKSSSDAAWVSGGSPLADVEGSMRSGDVLWVELTSAAQ